MVERKEFEEIVENIIKETKFIKDTIWPHRIAVKGVLPNGYIIYESTPAGETGLDPILAAAICHDKIVNKIYELEAYRFYCEKYEQDRRLKNGIYRG